MKKHAVVDKTAETQEQANLDVFLYLAYNIMEYADWGKKVLRI